MPISEQLLYIISIGSAQPSMMYSNALCKQFSQTIIIDFILFSLKTFLADFFQDLFALRLRSEYFMGLIFGKGCFLQVFGCSSCISPRMHKNNHLLVCDSLNDFFIENLVYHHHLSDSFLFGYSTKQLFKRYRPVTLIKVKKSVFRSHSQCCSNIFVVW